ncbi:MAG: small multi-drug export protein [Oscillospiraceae bacterium]|nr:small multi-drug export protein [Oscillospiraceae bacterium]
MGAFTDNLTEFIRGLEPWQQALMTFLLSIPPVLDRAAIPAAYASGLPWPVALPVSIAGNMLPVPFLLLFVKRVFAWLRKHTPFGRLADRFEAHAEKKSGTVRKYQFFGLMLFVGIPLPIPGTGAWTGALIAAGMNMRLKYAVWAIFCGSVMAMLLLTVLTYGLLDGLLGRAA